MNDEIKVRFGIDSINEEQFKLTKQFPEDITPNKLELRNLVESVIVRSREKISIRTGVAYSLDGQLLCELVINTTYYLEPFSDIITLNEDAKTVSFKSDVILTLLNIAVGNLRGVLYEKTKGTPLASFPLPLIPVSELVEMNRFKLG